MFSIMITVCVKEYAKTIEIIFATKYTAWKNKGKKITMITFKYIIIKVVVTTIISPLVIVLNSLTAVNLTSNYFSQASNTVKPPCATTSRKRPLPISDWLSKTPKLFQSKPSNTGTSHKQQPPVSDRDHYLGLTV